RAASTMLTGCSGPGATVWPRFSAISARSLSPSPDTLPPPSSSGTSRLVQPSSAARTHHAGSKERPSACRARTWSSDACLSRNGRAVETNSSVSGVLASAMLALILDAECVDGHRQQAVAADGEHQVHALAVVEVPAELCPGRVGNRAVPVEFVDRPNYHAVR